MFPSEGVHSCPINVYAMSTFFSFLAVNLGSSEYSYAGLLFMDEEQ